MSKIISIFFITLLLFSIVMPRNLFLGIKIKDILSVISIGYILYYYYIRKIKIKAKDLILAGIFLSFLNIFVLVGIGNFAEDSISQAKGFISLYLPVILILFISKHEDMEKIKKAIYFTMIFGIVYKIFLEILVFYNIVSFKQFANWYLLIFGRVPIFGFIESIKAVRIQVPSDYIVITIFSFYIVDRGINRKNKIITSVFMTIFVFIIYSRFVFVYYLLIVLPIALYSLVNQKIKRYQMLVFLILFSFFVYSLNSLDVQSLNTRNPITSIGDRFNGEKNSESDSLRDIQSESLWKKFQESNMLGNGFGAYCKETIRDNESKYTYEKEYLAFLMQLGFIGFAVIIFGTIVFFMYILRKAYIKNNDNLFLYIIILNFLSWVLKPLFNPFFTSSNSGFIIAIMYYFVSVLSQKIIIEEKTKSLSEI